MTQVLQNSCNKTIPAGTKPELGSDSNGDIYYYSGGDLVRLSIGTAGQVLKVVSGLPAWSSP